MKPQILVVSTTATVATKVEPGTCHGLGMFTEPPIENREPIYLVVSVTTDFSGCRLQNIG